eukprot:TRINITY_DN6795_c5_g1_i1.p1 TRINITY_DN6795_c5_g1~~TRINITY_DN6795_c5_g1_i1.p1  ORF type:complete len:411 (+),score=74.26 TRINITY_DN6795_c5_g1_i1:87-1235(+)
MDNLPKVKRDDDDDDMLQIKRIKLPIVSKGKPQPQLVSRKIDLKEMVGEKDDDDDDMKAEPSPVKKAPIPKPTVPEGIPFKAAEWYYSDDGSHKGPFSVDDLCDLYPETINPETYVWANGYISSWIPIKNVSELYSYVESVVNPTVGRTATKKVVEKTAKKPTNKTETEWFELKVNTSIYISNLPDDATIEELLAFFKNVGTVKQHPVTRQPRVKLYGNNDGLITFIKPQSVDLAIQMYHESCFRQSNPDSLINVTPAEFKKKGDVFKPKSDLAEYQQAMKKSKKQLDNQMSWTETDNDPLARTVVFQNMFSESLSTDLRQDIKKYASQFGTVEMVKPIKGSVSVRFKGFISAQQCIQSSVDKELSGRLLDICLWEDSNYKQ